MRCATFSVLLLVAIGQIGMAENYLSNGEFTFDTSGWVADGEEFYAVADDGFVPSGPGCAEQAITATDGLWYSATQTVRATASAHYAVGGSMRLPDGSSATDARIQFRWLSEDSSLSQIQWALAPDLRDHQWHEVTSFVSSPGWTVWLEVSLMVQTPSGVERGGDAELRWDNLVVDGPPREQIFADGFEINAMDGWSFSVP